MKSKIFLFALLMFFFTGISFAQTTRNVPGSYATIQAAVTASVSGDIIQVAAGTYTEQLNVGGQYNLTTWLIFRGSNTGISAGSVPGARNSETIINGGFRLWGGSSVIDGFTIQGGFTMGSEHSGVVVGSANGGSPNVTIENNIIKNCSVGSQSNGIEVVGSSTNLQILNNEIVNNWRGIYLNPTNGITVSGNNIHANNGVGVGIGSSGLSNITLTNNIIADHTAEGWGMDNVGVNVVAHNNQFTNNTVSIAWYPGTANTINATSNWWGNASGPSNAITNPSGTGSAVSNNVNYSPWWGANYINAAHPWTWYVNKSSTIQDGIVAATAGDFINVAAGTYAENVTVNKSLTITGTGLPAVTQFILAATPVTITGFASSSTGTITVNAGGNINNAIAIVSSGGTININVPGTYSAFTIDKPVTLVGGANVIIDHGSPAILVSSSGVTITGFTFSFASATDYAIDVQGGANNVTIYNCNFETTPGPGLGVINRGTGIVTAINNYWNAASGPTVASNPGGSGNTVNNASTGSIIYSPWWSDLAHTTLMGIPIQVNPPNTLTGISILPTFVWTWSGSNTHHFDLHITDGVNPITVGNISSSPYTLTEVDGLLLNNKSYSWYVTAVGLFTSTSSSTNSFQTILSAPALLSNPGSGVTVYSYAPISFSWYLSQPVGSLTFSLQYIKFSGTPSTTNWADVSITTTVPCNSNLTCNTENLLGGTKYSWRVITYRGTDVVSYSSQQWFKTAGGAVDAAAIPSWPVGGATVYTNAPTLYWYTNVSDLTGILFDVIISKQADLTSPLGTLVGATSLPTLYYNVSPDLEPGTLYYWAVVTHGTGDVSSTQSATKSFKTNGTGTIAQPYASYPSSGVTVYTQSPTFYWYLGSAASGITYKVYIDGTLNGSSGVDELFYTTGSTLTPGSHNWRVDATSGSQTPLSSSTINFTVAGGITQGIPFASWPIGNATIYTTTPTFSWYVTGSTLGLLGYKIGFSTVDAPTADGLSAGSPTDIHAPTYADYGTIVIPDVDARSYDFSSSGKYLGYGQPYYWTVRSYDGSGNSALQTSSRGTFTLAGTTGSIVPVVSQPNNTTIYSTSATLSWYVNGSTVGIAKYKVVLSRLANMDENNPTYTFISEPTDQFLNVSNLEPGATYYWEVASFNGTSYSQYSNPCGTFVVALSANSSVIVPLVGSPINGVGITSASAELSWVIPTQPSATLTYELQYSTQQDMSNPKTVSGITNLSQIVSGLESSQEYYWRVRSINDKGQSSSYSEVGKFIANSPTSVKDKDVIPAQFFVGQNYPNPFNPSTLIKYGLPNAANVTIKVFDMLGREVKTLVNEQKNAGTFSVQWNGDNNSGLKVTSGIYLFRIAAGTNIATKKMILLK